MYVRILALTFYVLSLVVAPLPYTQAASASGADFEQQVVELVNQARSDAGLPPLTVAPELVESARRYASYMATAGFFAHEGPDGSTLVSRAEAAGYRGWTYLAENLAGGQPDPGSVVRAWLNSPGHRANILSSRVREIGVGYANRSGSKYLHYWAQEFGARVSGNASQVLGVSVQAVPAGRFYVEAGGGRGGYRISDEGGMTFWTSFQALGGVDALGYPSSQRYQSGDGFTYQATQGALLQWRPELGRAVPANIFEMLQAAGKDDWLDRVKAIPRSIADDGSGGDVARAREIRLSWLTDDAIRAKYLAAGSTDRAVELYGLPMSRPERRGPFVVQRFQRAAFQHWVEGVPGMPAPGAVVRVLGGDLIKEAGLIPSSATQPTPG